MNINTLEKANNISSELVYLKQTYEKLGSDDANNPAGQYIHVPFDKLFCHRLREVYLKRIKELEKELEQL